MERGEPVFQQLLTSGVAIPPTVFLAPWALVCLAASAVLPHACARSTSLPIPLQCPVGSLRGQRLPACSQGWLLSSGLVIQDWASEEISGWPVLALRQARHLTNCRLALGQVEQWDPHKQTVLWIISGLLLAWPILTSRCCRRQPGRKCLSLTMRRSGNWASASWGSLRYCRRFWRTCYCTRSVTTFMSWPPPSLSSTTTAIALRRTGRVVSVGLGVLHGPVSHTVVQTICGVFPCAGKAVVALLAAAELVLSMWEDWRWLAQTVSSSACEAGGLSRELRATRHLETRGLVSLPGLGRTGGRSVCPGPGCGWMGFPWGRQR